MPCDARRLGRHRARLVDVDRVVAEVGQPQVAEQQAAVGVRVRAHAALALRRERGELGHELPARVEQLVRAVAPHPLLEHGDVLGLVHVAHRNLVAAPVALAELAVDLARTRPALRRAQHDHRPGRALHDAALARVGLVATLLIGTWTKTVDVDRTRRVLDRELPFDEETMVDDHVDEHPVDITKPVPAQVVDAQ